MLKGYSQEELQKHHVLFKITAKSDDDTVNMGEVVVGGEEGELKWHLLIRGIVDEIVLQICV